MSHTPTLISFQDEQFPLGPTLQRSYLFLTWSHWRASFQHKNIWGTLSKLIQTIADFGFKATVLFRIKKKKKNIFRAIHCYHTKKSSIKPWQSLANKWVSWVLTSMHLSVKPSPCMSSAKKRRRQQSVRSDSGAYSILY